MASRRADLFAVTETWLTLLDVVAKLEIVPPGYRFVHRPRTDRAAGRIGLLNKDDGEKESFKFSEWKITSGSFKRAWLSFIVHYTPRNILFSLAFFNEFSAFMESIILVLDPLIIMGDFNIHVDRGTDCINAARFLWVSRNM